RAPGSLKIEFEPGAESLFVLERGRTEDGRLKAADRFLLADGVWGKIDLPAEGSAGVIEAARRIGSIQALKDQNEVWDAQRRLLGDPNPLLVRTGFEETLEFRLGGEAEVVALPGHLAGPRPERGQGA